MAPGLVCVLRLMLEPWDGISEQELCRRISVGELDTLQYGRIIIARDALRKADGAHERLHPRASLRRPNSLAGAVMMDADTARLKILALIAEYATDEAEREKSEKAEMGSLYDINSYGSGYDAGLRAAANYLADIITDLDLS